MPLKEQPSLRFNLGLFLFLFIGQILYIDLLLQHDKTPK